jgi:cytidylate kinase
VIITIDGPAGSGKSTTARKLAARLGMPYLDTGAMYRVVTLAALEDGVDLEDEDALVNIADRYNYQLDLAPGAIRVTLNGRDVTESIRSMRVSDHTRFIAGSPGVRKILIRKQREIGRHVPNLVTEGRDQGSAVFPEAEIKFFVEAAVEKRAERRYHELLADGESVTLDEVLANVQQRDETDAARAVAPLIVPPDALRVDTTSKPIRQVVDEMVDAIHDAGLLGPDQYAAARTGDSG